MKKIILILCGLFVIFLFGCVQQEQETNKESPADVDSYIACGCGCCGGEEPAEEKCLYHSKGDDIQKIIEANKKVAQSPDCPFMGCSRGTKYIYCD